MKKAARFMWSALGVFIVVSALQIVLGLSGKIIPDVVIWFYLLSLGLFVSSVLSVLYQKKKES